MASKIAFRQIRSASGHPADQRATVRALGIRRLNQVVTQNDTPQVRGMLFKLRHLIEILDQGKVRKS